ncbi:MAG: STAS domain-containing protein [Planctomycetes bacterium]|nr:STAS domain-containing protein [Planctomycetota bacterium]
MTSDESTRLRVYREQDVTIVQLADRKILDEVRIMQIGEDISNLIASADQPKLVIDFGNVAHLSSSALGMLITVHKRIVERSGQMCLCNIQPSIYEIFVITRLNKIFRVCRSRDEAITSIA